MSKFKNGNYVKTRLEGVNTVYRVYGYSSEKIVMLERKSIRGTRFTTEAHEDMLCLATNNDYLNTLTPKQKAKFLHNFRCCDVCVYRDTDVCHNTSSDATTCEDGLELWLENSYDGWEVKE